VACLLWHTCLNHSGVSPTIHSKISFGHLQHHGGMVCGGKPVPQLKGNQSKKLVGPMQTSAGNEQQMGAKDG